MGNQSPRDSDHRGYRSRTKPPSEGHWVQGFVLVDLEREEQINTFFKRENAERKKENLIEAWEEYTEETLEVVEILVDIS